MWDTANEKRYNWNPYALPDYIKFSDLNTNAKLNFLFKFESTKFKIFRIY